MKEPNEYTKTIELVPAFRRVFLFSVVLNIVAFAVICGILLVLPLASQKLGFWASAGFAWFVFLVAHVFSYLFGPFSMRERIILTEKSDGTYVASYTNGTLHPGQAEGVVSDIHVSGRLVFRVVELNLENHENTIRLYPWKFSPAKIEQLVSCPESAWMDDWGN